MDNTAIDARAFQESITKELDVIKDRVRNLIGLSNWGEEGRYKEAILRNVIKRFLPNNMSIGTGFVIKGSEDEGQVSSQIDIIIYDNTIPVLFSEGDFIITTCRNVRAIIEVKTKIRNNDFQQIVNKSKNNGKLIGNEIFNGIFSYEYEDNVKAQCIKDALRETNGYVTHISLGKNIFIRFWKDANLYKIYRLDNLSFSYFISNLLASLCPPSKLKDRWWFLYPIREGKEVHKIDTIRLEDIG